MSTYRERRLARAERLRGWAEKREAKSDAAHEKVHQIADGIPFGQPILVGHHSERHARRDQARMESGMRASIEHADKARDMASRADNIEAQAEHAIYSDDDDAVERLEERIAELEAHRDRIKGYNALRRKRKNDEGVADDMEAAGLTEAEKRSLLSSLQFTAYACKYGAFPAYELSNLSANIRRNRERLAQVKAGPSARPERVITARYSGTCDACGGKVERGDPILYRRGEPIKHVTCPTAEHDAEAWPHRPGSDRTCWCHADGAA